jgi:hypothetical protein
MDFQLAQYGQVFSTRPRGLELRRGIESSLSPGESVVVSFESVARVSQSFSDEFLGALIAEVGVDRVSVAGPISPNVDRVLNRALGRRGFADAILAPA